MGHLQMNLSDSYNPKVSGKKINTRAIRLYNKVKVMSDLEKRNGLLWTQTFSKYEWILRVT